MLDFHGKEIDYKVLTWFTEQIYKSTKYLSISSLIYKVGVGSKFDKIDGHIYYSNLFKKCIFNNLEGKISLKLFWVFILQIFRGKSNILGCESQRNFKTRA